MQHCNILLCELDRDNSCRLWVQDYCILVCALWFPRHKSRHRGQCNATKMTNLTIRRLLKNCYENVMNQNCILSHVMYMIILIALFEIPKLLFDFFLKITLFSKSQIIQITISRIYGYLPKNTVFYDVFTQIRTITNIYEQTSRTEIGIMISSCI